MNETFFSFWACCSAGLYRDFPSLSLLGLPGVGADWESPGKFAASNNRAIRSYFICVLLMIIYRKGFFGLRSSINFVFVEKRTNSALWTKRSSGWIELGCLAFLGDRIRTSRRPVEGCVIDCGPPKKIQARKVYGRSVKNYCQRI